MNARQFDTARLTLVLDRLDRIISIGNAEVDGRQLAKEAYQLLMPEATSPIAVAAASFMPAPPTFADQVRATLMDPQMMATIMQFAQAAAPKPPVYVGAPKEQPTCDECEEWLALVPLYKEAGWTPRDVREHLHTLLREADANDKAPSPSPS